MIFNFNFNPDTHNFWPIYDAIRNTYPIGITGSYPSIFFKDQKLLNLDEKIVNAIHNESNFQAWKTFEEEMGRDVGLEVVGTTYGQAPSLSFDIIIDRIESQDFKRVKKLSVAISLVDNFFSIYGVDETFVLEMHTSGFNTEYQAVNAITVSPYKEFETIFFNLKNAVETRFKGFKFVPYAICSMTLEGLRVRYKEYTGSTTIFNALFNQFIDTFDGPLRGDRYFGYDDWQVALVPSDTTA